jgi:hypothetical protein
MPFTILPPDTTMRGFCVGGIAQLGERLHGMQEVSGSIPLTSTNLPTSQVTQDTTVLRQPRPHRLEA